METQQTLVIDRGVPVPPYFQLVAYVRERVQSGEWPPGYQLPSVADWERQLGLAKATVQRALRDMSTDGLIVTRQGVGAFVAQRIRPAPARSHEPILAVDSLAHTELQRAELVNRLGARFGPVKMQEDSLHPDLRRLPLECVSAVRHGLEPLDDLLATEAGRDFSQPDDLDFLRVEGRHYVVPAFVNVWLLGYNRDRFDESGVEPPTAEWSWEQLLEAAARLTDARAGRFGFSLTPPSPLFLGLLVNAGGELLDEAGKRCLLREPEAVTAAQFLRQLSRFAPKEPADPLVTRGLERAMHSFLSGRAAMTYCGQATVYENILHPNYRLGAVPFPKQRRQMSLLLAFGWALDRYAAHPEVAREALRLLAQQDMWPAAKVQSTPLAINPKYQITGGVGVAYRAAMSCGRPLFGNLKPAARGPAQLAVRSLLLGRLEEIIYSPEPVERVLADVARQIDGFLMHTEHESRFPHV